MDNNNIAEVTDNLESVQDGAVQAQDEQAEALSAALAAGEEAAETTDEAVGNPDEEPNKALRGRMKSYEARGYKRGQQEAEAKWAEEKKSYEEKLAKYAERDLQDEAAEMANKRHIPADLALEYVRMKHGLAPKAEETQARDESGRFASQQGNDSGKAAVQQRAAALMAQAENFERMSDGAVSKDAILEAFQNDESIREAVAKGEMDFIDVGRRLAGGKKSAPHIIKSANNGGISRRSFANMSDDEFSKFDERVRHGAVFDARR